MISGFGLLLGLLLVTAGVPKVIAPRYSASAMRRVIRRTTVHSDTVLLAAARALGGWEILLGTALVAGWWALPTAAATVLTFTGFLGFVIAAMRRGASCGCWATLTEGPAGGAEIARTAALTGIAVTVLAGRLTGDTSHGIGPATLGWAAGALATVLVAAHLGGLLAPVRAERVRTQLRYQAPPTRRGRFWAWLTFHAGFVHAGTDAGRRRYALARNAPGRVRTRSTVEGRTWQANRT